jgi:hypothetical protein
MTTSIPFYTQGLRGFKYEKTHRKHNTEYCHVRSSATHLSCPSCRSANTVIVKTARRVTFGVCTLVLKNDFRVRVRRVRRSNCGTCAQEPITFGAGPYLTYTKWPTVAKEHDLPSPSEVRKPNSVKNPKNS